MRVFGVFWLESPWVLRSILPDTDRLGKGAGMSASSERMRLLLEILGYNDKKRHVA
jgi:hypothetical protein